MTLLGLDASHHQGVIDFAAVKRAGNSFAFLKATEGTGYTDPTFAANRAKARAAGLVVGAYAFASATDPVAEANYFCRTVGALQTGDLVALDWETSHPNPPAWSRAWLDRVAAVLGVRPLIYMNQSTRDRFDWTPVIAGNYGLWLAQYDNSTAVPSPGRWPNVAMKQFTSSGSVPGVSGSCDRNVFFGDATALAAYGYQPSGADMTPAELFAAPMRAADGKDYPFSVFIANTNNTSYQASRQVTALEAQVASLAATVAGLVATVNKLAATPVPVAQAAQVASLVLTGLDGAKLSVTPPGA